MLSGPAAFVFLSFLMAASVSATVNWLGMLWSVSVLYSCFFIGLRA